LAKIKDLKLNEEQASGGVALGETSTTAYRGDRGKTAYDHSQATHAPSNAQKNSDITKAEIEAKLTGSITSHTHNLFELNYVLASSYTISSTDSWETVLESAAFPVAGVSVEFIAQLTFRERNASAGIFYLRVIDDAENVYAGGIYPYLADEVKTVTLSGYGDVGGEKLLRLQVYGVSGDTILETWSVIEKITSLLISGIVTQ